MKFLIFHISACFDSVFEGWLGNASCARCVENQSAFSLPKLLNVRYQKLTPVEGIEFHKQHFNLWLGIASLWKPNQASERKKVQCVRWWIFRNNYNASIRSNINFVFPSRISLCLGVDFSAKMELLCEIGDVWFRFAA